MFVRWVLPIGQLVSTLVKTNLMEASDVTTILADNIQAHLDRRGMSMAALSRSAGTNDTAVYDILKKRTRSPKLDTIAKIAKALDVTVIELLTTGNRKDAEREILAAFSKLSVEDQEKLLATAKIWSGID